MQLVGLDDDGVDLKFTISRRNPGVKRVKNFNGVNTLRKHLLAARPRKVRTADSEPESGPVTDIVPTLRRIFQEYREKVFPKAMTLIVLTNGLWPGSKSAKRLNETLIEFARWLEEMDYGARHFSITFIRFGDDAKAKRRLRYLDDELCTAQGVGYVSKID